MKRWLHLLRTVMALCAIVAYGLPVVTHGAVAHDGAHAGQQHATVPCDHDSAADHHAYDGSVSHQHDAAPDEPAKCPTNKDGSASCCVAMCHAALPMPDYAAPWVPQLRAASDSRIIDRAGPTFITRLDRPPKPIGAPIG
jgi:hypothetical protein